MDDCSKWHKAARYVGRGRRFPPTSRVCHRDRSPGRRIVFDPRRPPTKFRGCTRGRTVEDLQSDRRCTAAAEERGADGRIRSMHPSRNALSRKQPELTLRCAWQTAEDGYLSSTNTTLD